MILKLVPIWNFGKFWHKDFKISTNLRFVTPYMEMYPITNLLFLFWSFFVHLRRSCTDNLSSWTSNWLKQFREITKDTLNYWLHAIRIHLAVEKSYNATLESVMTSQLWVCIVALSFSFFLLLLIFFSSFSLLPFATALLFSSSCECLLVSFRFALSPSCLHVRTCVVIHSGL